MSHKGDSSFFEQKRPWSRQKDLILGYYLTAYLPKIATQGRPIQIVDAFAGPGKFKSGEPGSPLIISSKIEARQPTSPVPIGLLLVDNLESHTGSLKTIFRERSYVTVLTDTFLNAVPSIRDLSAKSSVFLYVDPWAIEGLEWRAMDSVFEYVERGQSIEVLFNFNSPAFVRRGLAAIGRSLRANSESDQETEGGDTVPLAALDAAVGGPWWRPIVQEGDDFAGICRDVANGVCARLRTRFNEVCRYDVFEDPRHSTPKFSLLFGSRHPDALELMNDATVKARDEIGAKPEAAANFLFEMRSEDFVPDPTALRPLVLAAADVRMRRGRLVQSIIRQNFCKFSSSQIRKCISELAKTGVLETSTGKSRINDDVEVWRK